MFRMLDFARHFYKLPEENSYPVFSSQTTSLFYLQTNAKTGHLKSTLTLGFTMFHFLCLIYKHHTGNSESNYQLDNNINH